MADSNDSAAGRGEQEIYDARLRKAEALKALGVNPFGAGHKVHDAIGHVVASYGGFDAAGLEGLKEKPRAAIAGRIVAERSFGKAGFLKLRDRTGELQVYVKKDVLGDAAYEIVKLAEVGDVVAAEGSIFRSKTNELTLQAEKFTVLTKALRTLPEKWHGLTDVETRYRQRYLDLIANEDVRKLFLRRSAIVKEIRAFLDGRGFVEVETPMMHPLVGGATARPFTTHHNALDLDLYMRIAPELYLKRLVVGGFERVYEINRNFRNEGISVRHNPEFTMLELYQAHATFDDLMVLTEELFSDLARKVVGSTDITYQGHKVSLAAPFRRLSMVEGVREALKLTDAQVRDVAELRKRVTDLSPAEIAKLDWGHALAHLFDAHVEQTLIQPTFVTEYPTDISPLARRNDARPEIVDRFELYVAGRELANAFTELNDPVDQRERFEAQVKAKAAGAAETMDYDADYIRALEQGMPPTAGEGIGIDRLVMLLTDAASIRDVILFPLLRKQV